MSTDPQMIALRHEDIDHFPVLKDCANVRLPLSYEWSVPEVMLHFCFTFDLAQKGVKRYQSYPQLRIGSYRVQRPYHCDVDSICVDETDGKIFLIRASASPQEIHSKDSANGTIQFLNSSIDQLAESFLLFREVDSKFEELKSEQNDADETGEAIMREFKNKMMSLDPAIWESGYSYWCESIEDYLEDW